MWRHRWEETGESQHQEMLVTYNREDCEALWFLLEELSRIIVSADTPRNIDFADRPKQHATELGHQIHRGLQNIIVYAHADYNKNRVSIRSEFNTTETERTKRGGQKGHQGYRRKIPSRANTVIRVASKRICPKHKKQSLAKSVRIAEKFIISLRFTKTGCRRIVTKYIGTKGYCSKCKQALFAADDFGTRYSTIWACLQGLGDSCQNSFTPSLSHYRSRNGGDIS